MADSNTALSDQSSGTTVWHDPMHKKGCAVALYTIVFFSSTDGDNPDPHSCPIGRNSEILNATTGAGLTFSGGTYTTVNAD